MSCSHSRPSSPLSMSATRFTPPITPAAASPPVRPHQWGLRPRCQTQLNLQVKWSNMSEWILFTFCIFQVLHGLILFFLLSGTNMWPRSSAQAPVSPHYESSLISLVNTSFDHMPEVYQIEIMDWRTDIEINDKLDPLQLVAANIIRNLYLKMWQLHWTCQLTLNKKASRPIFPKYENVLIRFQIKM